MHSSNQNQSAIHSLLSGYEISMDMRIFLENTVTFCSIYDAICMFGERWI